MCSFWLRWAATVVITDNFLFHPGCGRSPMIMYIGTSTCIANSWAQTGIEILRLMTFGGTSGLLSKTHIH